MKIYKNQSNHSSQVEPAEKEAEDNFESDVRDEKAELSSDEVSESIDEQSEVSELVVTEPESTEVEEAEVEEAVNAVHAVVNTDSKDEEVKTEDQKKSTQSKEQSEAKKLIDKESLKQTEKISRVETQKQPESDAPTLSDRLKALLIQIQNDIEYFVQCYKEDRKTAFSWWWKTRKQNEALKQAIEALHHDMFNDNFTLDKIAAALAPFTLRENDRDRILWFKDAHQKITQLSLDIKTGKSVEKSFVQRLQTQLGFIANSEEFCQRFHLEKARKEVFKMYKELTSLLEALKTLEKDKIAQKEQELALESERLKTEKAASEAKAAQMQAIAQKEARLAAVEEKRKAVAFKEAEQVQLEKEEKLAEIKAQEAETQRQLQLQASFVDMQVQDKLNNLSTKELCALITAKALDNNIEEDDKALLTTLKNKLEAVV